MKKINYSAVVLDELSHEKLTILLDNLIKENNLNKSDYKVYCHHSTITLGELPEEYKSKIGTTAKIEAIEYGISDKAIAVKVNGTENLITGIPHVTLATNIKNNGKPKDSNDITNWKPLNNNIKLTGIIEEII